MITTRKLWGKKNHNVSLSSKLFYDVLDRNAYRPEPTQAWHRLLLLFHGRTSSVDRALDCKAGRGRGLDPRGRINTQDRKITEKRRYCVCPANGYTLGGLDDHFKWWSLRRRRKLKLAANNFQCPYLVLLSSFLFSLILTFDIIIFFASKLCFRAWLHDTKLELYSEQKDKRIVVKHFTMWKKRIALNTIATELVRAFYFLMFMSSVIENANFWVQSCPAHIDYTLNCRWVRF